MRIAVVFDTPYAGWDHAAHLEQLRREIGVHDEPDVEYQVAHVLMERGHELLLVGVKEDVRPMLDALRAWQPELVFNASESFHGEERLDYLIPGLLDAEGYRYTGSSPLALLVTRNKAISKKILAFHGIQVPGFATYRLQERVTTAPDLRFPLIVKPLQTDASKGIAQASGVWDVDALADRVDFVHQRFDQPAIAEEFVDGRELYVGLVGPDADPEVLPFTEMVFDKAKTKPEERIATTAAKWDVPYRTRKGIRNVFARRIARAARERIEAVCRTAYRALWLRDYARLDVRLTPDGEVWVIEANANPFISDGHDMANMAWKAGMQYPEFVERLVNEAVARYERA
jgi:D-alanine-D-alanine ligase